MDASIHGLATSKRLQPNSTSRANPKRKVLIQVRFDQGLLHEIANSIKSASFLIIFICASISSAKVLSAMSLRPRTQRVRDPLHNLVEFGTDQLEECLWKVVQTPPFQRLRRVRQLGFSELVYPGATHTRFSHSIGAFHTARKLMWIIVRHIENSRLQVQDHQKNVALAAALVHDVGHGMFSHAFEDVGKRLSIQMAKHELVSDRLIRESEISNEFACLGSGFANDVADTIKRGRHGDLYGAVVSSQFDADRLDYMQRDRLMTGVQNSGIDFQWLLNNLEVGEVPVGSDDVQSGKILTFVLGEKAIHAAESYILSLFQLYPTIYFHKATRGAEKIFSELVIRIFKLARDGNIASTGLPPNHSLIKFAADPESIELAINLDDTVFWGALPLLIESSDQVIRELAARLWKRNLYKCFDVRKSITKKLQEDGKLSDGAAGKEANVNVVNKASELVSEKIQELLGSDAGDAVPRMLVDKATRDPYKRFQDSKGMLNQINIRDESGRIVDISEVSAIASMLEPFELHRIYFNPDETGQTEVLSDIVNDSVAQC